MINWAYFPKSTKSTDLSVKVVEAFESILPEIDSAHKTLKSDDVLAVVADNLSKIGFQVERGKKRFEKIEVPVLFGMNGRVEKSFNTDALHKVEGFVLEVEAGRATINHQFLKDLFQACMMHDANYLGIAVRNIYEAAGAKSKDFDKVVTFFDTLYASNRMQLPLKGVLIIGY